MSITWIDVARYRMKKIMETNTTTDSSVPSRHFKYLTSLLGISATAIGSGGLLGWLLHSTVLMSIRTNFPSMKPNTAIGILLLGMTIVLLESIVHQRQARRLIEAIPLMVATLGACTLFEYLAGVSLGIDEFFFKDSANAVETWNPGRMSAIAGISFLISGLAIYLKAHRYKRLPLLPDLLALLVCFVATFALLGYLYDAEPLRNLGMMGGMALHTAAGFLAIGLAALLLRPAESLVPRLLSSRRAGAVLVWVLPMVVAGPVTVDWLRHLGERAGFYGHDQGIAISVAMTILFLVVFTLIATHAVDHADRNATRAEAVVEKFFDLSNDLLCIANMNGYFVKLNNSWERTLGFTTGELTKQPFIDFVHPDDVAPTIEQYTRQAGGNDVISFENRYRCGDGSYRTLLWNATQPVNNGLIYASAHDITERKQMEQEVVSLNDALAARAQASEALNSELEAFSYSVSHDLRAPLRSIDGFSQALLEDYSSTLDNAGKDFLNRVRSSTQRMGQLIDDMLQLSRVTRTDFHRESVDLSQLARSVADALRDKFPDRTVDIIIQDELQADCDPRLVRIALENLFDNAWKYTSTRNVANIRFGTLAQMGYPVYMISDDGVGFDPNYAAKLFSPFQRLHRQEDFEGTGIGLATVKRIVTRHGGTVWAESETNQGATFYFTLAPSGLKGEDHVGENHSVSRGQPGRRPVDTPCA